MHSRLNALVSIAVLCCFSIAAVMTEFLFWQSFPVRAPAGPVGYGREGEVLYGGATGGSIERGRNRGASRRPSFLNQRPTPTYWAHDCG